MRRVVLTAFEPFGSHSVNSSLEVGRALARRPPRGIDLDFVVLPVVAGRCVAGAWECVAQVEPDLVLALGQAAGAAALRVEARAVNVNDFAIADNAGNQFRRQPVTPDGPAVYAATTLGPHLVRELRRRRIAAELSGSAGTYVCNHLFYGLLHRAARAQRTHQTGFLHLPLLLGQLRRREQTPARTLEEMVEGVRLAISASLDGEAARRRGSGRLPPGGPSARALPATAPRSSARTPSR